MNVICTAVVEDERQRLNLCECVSILGIRPVVSGDTVCAEFTGAQSTADKLIELFSQFDVHGTVAVMRR